MHRRRLGRLLLMLIALSVLIAGCGGRPSPPKLAVTPTSWDFGEIPVEIVEHTFTLKNDGGSTLHIQNVSTSCGCTEAILSATDLPPGETSEMVVSFDPNAHPGSYGRFVRLVYLQSNDPERPEVQIEITATVKAPSTD